MNEQTLTEEQARVIDELTALRANGWKDLPEDLDAFFERARSVVVRPAPFGHPRNDLVHEAEEAIRLERHRRLIPGIFRDARLKGRKTALVAGVGYLEQAIERLEKVAAIEPPQYNVPAEPKLLTSDDAVAMADDELARVRDATRGIMSRCKTEYGKQAGVLSKLKTKEAQRLAKELEAVQKQHDHVRSIAERTLEVVTAELDARERSRAEAQQKREHVEENIVDIMKDLQERMDAIEAK